MSVEKSHKRPMAEAKTHKRDPDRKPGKGARPATMNIGPEPAGLGARRLAVRLIEAVLRHGQTLEDALTREERQDGPALDPRDRAFAHMIAATVLRRRGSLDAVLAGFIARPLPKEAARAQSILLTAAAQILLLDTPRHAAINLAVEQCRRDQDAQYFDKLANAVLRKVANDGPAVLAKLDWPRVDIPDWIWKRWTTAYGPDLARALAAASLREAPLDISVKVAADAETWATRLGGQLLSTGSIRLATHGRVETLEGFAEGAWWVQDAAAALPARCFGDVRGLDVADLCAAPGGKSAALAAAGAKVTAVDISPDRLARLAENMTRLGFANIVETVSADILAWSTDKTFDAVLLDAPCTSTGTIRRHPDLLHLKRQGDIARLTQLQGKLLAKAASLVKPGGTLVYCTCSIEPEEGAAVVDAFLQQTTAFRRVAVTATEIGAEPVWITAAGDLRTLPCHMPLDPPELGGMDGFYAARLVRL